MTKVVKHARFQRNLKHYLCVYVFGLDCVTGPDGKSCNEGKPAGTTGKCYCDCLDSGFGGKYCELAFGNTFCIFEKLNFCTCVGKMGGLEEKRKKSHRHTHKKNSV